MRSALDEAGISRERIGLVGIDGSAITYPLLEFFALGLDIDPFVDAYARHFYNLRFDYLPPADGSWTSPISDVMDRQTAQLARYTNHRGKPLLVTEIGTFYYGWRFGNPAGAASLDATLTVAEGVIRALNIGAECFAFWSLMNPNTIDGQWSAIAVEERKLIRCGYPFAIYGMLSRTLRPSSRVYPLVVSPGSVLCPLHGTVVERPDGSWVALVVNDSPSQNLAVEIHLPEQANASTWSVEVTDRVRFNEKQPALNTLPDQRLVLTAPAFSLVALQSGPTE